MSCSSAGCRRVVEPFDHRVTLLIDRQMDSNPVVCSTARHYVHLELPNESIEVA